MLVGAGGLVFAFLAWLSARRSVRISEEQGEHTREQAERQPALEGRVCFEPSTRRSRRSKFASPEVQVFNTGKTAAHDVHGWIYFDAERLSPYAPGPPTYRDPATGMSTPMLMPHIERSWGQSCSEDQEPEDGFYEAQVWESDKLLPGTQKDFRFDVRIQAPGEATVRCRLISADRCGVRGDDHNLGLH